MVIVFDVDGTILDTYPLIRASYLEVFRRLKPDFICSEELLKSFFGPPLPDTFRNIVPDEEIDKYVEEYHRVSREKMKEYLRVFPNTFSTLQTLKTLGYKLAIDSNKLEEAIIESFNVVGLDGYFDLIIGYDTVKNPKPHQEGIRTIESTFHDSALLVGDSVFDIKTAKNAKVKSIGVTWALTTKADLQKAGADYVIDDFRDLIKIVKELK